MTTNTSSRLEKIIASGHFAVTSECGPPRNGNAEGIQRKAEILRGYVDAINVTDNQTAVVRQYSLASCIRLKLLGLEPVLQMVTRDRNRIALQSDLLGATSFGVSNVLCLTGDHQRFGDHPNAVNVFDMDSTRLIQTVKMMRGEGRLLGGHEMHEGRPQMFIGAAENPFADPFEIRVLRLAKKVAAGAQFIQTQCIYNMPKFKEWMGMVRNEGLHEKVIRDGCKRLLSAEGFRVLTAEHGREALDLLACEEVEVILCDLKVPVMGALEVLEEANICCPGVPLIVITGHGTVANAVECMKMGAYDFITKPFRGDHLVLVVRRALEKRELEPFLPQPASLPDCISNDLLIDGLERIVENAGAKAELISRELCRGRMHLRALSAPVYGSDRQVLGTVTVFHDITSFKELDQMKSNFVHMVSHELRSPLAAIKQQLSVILEGLAGDLTPKQKDLLGRSQDKIQNLLELINDLLDVAKIESGQAMQQQLPMNLAETLESTVALMKARAESSGISLLCDLPDALPLIQADQRCMEEVFTNLISNAINYSPGGGSVMVSAIPRGSYLEVLVRDTGIGIDHEEIPKIFDKFYRVKHPSTRQVVGTGLGLAIVKGILDSHRGSIEVESQPGVGTTFRVLLPTI